MEPTTLRVTTKLLAMVVKTMSYSRLLSSLENQLRMESATMSWSLFAELQSQESHMQGSAGSSSISARPDVAVTHATLKMSN